MVEFSFAALEKKANAFDLKNNIKSPNTHSHTHFNLEKDGREFVLNCYS